MLNSSHSSDSGNLRNDDGFDPGDLGNGPSLAHGQALFLLWEHAAGNVPRAVKCIEEHLTLSKSDTLHLCFELVGPDPESRSMLESRFDKAVNELSDAKWQEYREVLFQRNLEKQAHVYDLGDFLLQEVALIDSLRALRPEFKVKIHYIDSALEESDGFRLEKTFHDLMTYLNSSAENLSREVLLDHCRKCVSAISASISERDPLMMSQLRTLFAETDSTDKFAVLIGAAHSDIALQLARPCDHSVDLTMSAFLQDLQTAIGAESGSVDALAYVAMHHCQDTSFSDEKLADALMCKHLSMLIKNYIKESESVNAFEDDAELSRILSERGIENFLANSLYERISVEERMRLFEQIFSLTDSEEPLPTVHLRILKPLADWFDDNIHPYFKPADGPQAFKALLQKLHAPTQK